MDDIKYFAIYLDNSCEVHFNPNQNENMSKLFLSPCGSEFVYRTYDHQTNTIQSTFKYRTAYPISIHFEKLSRVLRIRNRYCDDRPFISPILEEHFENSSSILTSCELLTEAVWKTTQIELDSKNSSYIWKSKCSRAELKLHMNKSVAYIKYPVKIPRPENDPYPTKQLVSKYIYKYTSNEQEISVLNPPAVWAELVKAALEIVNKTNKEAKEIKVRLPEAMPLSCSSTHLHKFDDIPLSSEPKVIFLDQSWFKIYYKSKSVEIDCPVVIKDGELVSEYYVSDSTSGKYFTCYTLNPSKPTVDEIKFSLDNLPSFKTHEKKILNYASILLKRVNSIKLISSFSNCYTNEKVVEIDEDEILTSRSSNRLDMAKFDLNPISVKRQFYIEDTGHFKCFDDQSIIISFIDRVKLVVDEHSIDAFLSGRTDKAFCTVYLPDSSQHELCWGQGRDKLDDYFKKYLVFFDQWLEWLILDGTIRKTS